MSGSTARNEKLATWLLTNGIVPVPLALFQTPATPGNNTSVPGETITPGTMCAICNKHQATRHCRTCRKPLCFPCSFSYGSFEYCGRDLPYYDKHQQW
jgi:hypothetical protein